MKVKNQAYKKLNCNKSNLKYIFQTKTKVNLTFKEHFSYRKFNISLSNIAFHLDTILMKIILKESNFKFYPNAWESYFIYCTKKEYLTKTEESPIQNSITYTQKFSLYLI